MSFARKRSDTWSASWTRPIRKAYSTRVIPAVAPRENDALRTPYEILGPQLIGYHLSLGIGLNPDNPSPNGVINRVVQGVRIHPPYPLHAKTPGL